MADYFESGFCVREASWHRKENLLMEAPVDDDGRPSWEKARKAAGLEWDVEMVPTFRRTTVTATDEIPAGFVPLAPLDGRATWVDADGDGVTYVHTADVDIEGFIPSTKACSLIRNDTEAELGSVSPSYSPLYIEQMGRIAEALAGQGAMYDTAISVKGGEQVAVVMKLDEPMAIAGDDTDTIPYFSILNDFTGGGAAKLIYTPVRVVCWNTYQMAAMLAEQTGHQYVWRHVGDMEANVSAAIEALSGLRSSFAAWVELAEALALEGIDEDEVKLFTNLFIPEPSAELITDRQRANIARDRVSFMRLYNESPTTDGHRGNALGLLDAAVEWSDYVRKASNNDVLLTRTLLKPNMSKRGALALIADVTGAKVPESVKFN
jgi:phage/plasmid-like protein (TIGR03299 family)